MAHHNDIGNKGEEIATNHLVEKGWQILHKNWRFGKDEIDIIAQTDDTIVFVEVKTRHNNFFGNPHEFVSPQKQKRIIKAAGHFMEKQKLDLEVRFDIVGIILNNKYQKIEHIEDAYSPRW